MSYVSRIKARIEHLVAELDPEAVGVTLAAVDRHRVRDEVVHAHEFGHSSRLGALARALLARIVFGLAGVHEGTELLRLFRRTGINGDDGNALGDDAFDRGFEDIGDTPPARFSMGYLIVDEIACAVASVMSPSDGG
jgi:hypothetical protein